MRVIGFDDFGGGGDLEASEGATATDGRNF